MRRSQAEKKYGMGLYQGGAVPGPMVRVVEIPGEDVEACGGTHMHNTSEIGKIKILKTQKIQDGIIRVTFTGGNAVDRLEKLNQRIVSRITSILKVPPEVVISRIKEIIEKKKILQKSLYTGNPPPNAALVLRKRKKIQLSNFDLIEQISDILKCSTEVIESTILKNLNEFTRLVSLHKNKSTKEEKEKPIALFGDYTLLIKEYPDLNPKEILSIAQNLIKTSPKSILITIGSNLSGLILNGLLGEEIISMQKIHLGNDMREIISQLGGKGGGRAENFQGFLPIKDTDERGDLIDTLIKNLHSSFKERMESG
jgi:alanyl-tRNA synthetase